MRAGAAALIVVSRRARTVRAGNDEEETMTKRFLIAAAALAVALAGAAFAFGGGRGIIFDDGRPVQPGSLDDGKDLLPLTRVSLADAVAAAQRAATGQLGQVDLERYQGRIVYSVDVGDREVKVDAATGAIAGTAPRS
jgi:hypothetical protein